MTARWVRTESADGTFVAACRTKGWDVCIKVRLPEVPRGTLPRFPARLAHQIRKDLSRLLQRLCGFAPIVEIRVRGRGLEIRAGGSPLAGPAPTRTGPKLAALVDDPHRRARWIGHARRGVSQRPSGQPTSFRP